MKLYKIQWPTAAIAIAGIAGVVLVAIFAPDSGLLAPMSTLFIALAAAARQLVVRDPS